MTIAWTRACEASATWKHVIMLLSLSLCSHLLYGTCTVHVCPMEWVHIAWIREMWGLQRIPTGPWTISLTFTDFCFSWQVGMKTFQKWSMKPSRWATRSWWRARADTGVSAALPGLPFGPPLCSEETLTPRGRSTARRDRAPPCGACGVVLSSVPSSLSPLSLLCPDPSQPFPALWQQTPDLILTGFPNFTASTSSIRWGVQFLWNKDLFLSLTPLLKNPPKNWCCLLDTVYIPHRGTEGPGRTASIFPCSLL